MSFDNGFVVECLRRLNLDLRVSLSDQLLLYADATYGPKNHCLKIGKHVHLMTSFCDVTNAQIWSNLAISGFFAHLKLAICQTL